MAISHVQTVEAMQTGFVNSITATWNSQPAAGSLMVAALAWRQETGPGNLTLPSGWALIEDALTASSVSGFLAYKFAGAGESTSLPISWDGDPQRTALAATNYTGLASLSAAHTQNGPASATSLSTGTTSSAQGLALAMWAHRAESAWGTASSLSNSFERRASVGSGGAGRPRVDLASRIYASATAAECTLSANDGITTSLLWSAIAVFSESGTPPAVVRRRLALLGVGR